MFSSQKRGTCWLMCSINIIQTLHSVCIHIEDVHLLLWADLTKSVHFPYVELSNFFITI